MPNPPAHRTAHPRPAGAPLRRVLLAALLTTSAVAAAPAASRATVVAFGSPLAVPATLDTARDLNYTAAHHDGADTALWNVALAAGVPSAPADGQILSVRLEGCARPASGGPAPLTQIHFQDLVPQGGGAVRVNVTTQPFDIPICGQNGASASSITTYSPTNFCVKQGDYVDFNDEGGFNNQYYPSGVPYEVIGSVSGSTMDSFIGNNATNNGATLSPSATSPTSGFATNRDEELMLQATLGSGPDATPLCPGGTQGTSPAPSGASGGAGPGASPTAPSSPAPIARTAVKIRRQTDGVNHSRRVKVALFCAQSAPCVGSVAILLGGVTLASGPFNVPGHETSHVSLRLSPVAMKLVRGHHRRLATTMMIELTRGGSFTGPVILKI